jgi:hypothetical protein
LRPYTGIVLDEETGEWAPAEEDPERDLEREAETEYEDMPPMSDEPTCS